MSSAETRRRLIVAVIERYKTTVKLSAELALELKAYPAIQSRIEELLAQGFESAPAFITTESLDGLDTYDSGDYRVFLIDADDEDGLVAIECETLFGKGTSIWVSTAHLELAEPVAPPAAS